MPWRKNFDVDKALGKAMEVFWSQGYAATSISDLTEAMGINKGSLYNAYEGKEKLFIEVLSKYDVENHRQTLASLDAMEDPIEAVSVLFDALIEQSIKDGERKGCLLVNTALELPFHSEVVERIVTASLGEIDAFFRRCVARAQNRGQVSTDLDPDETAKGLLTLVMGLRVLARGAVPAESLRAIKRQAMRLIGVNEPDQKPA